MAIPILLPKLILAILVGKELASSFPTKISTLSVPVASYVEKTYFSSKNDTLQCDALINQTKWCLFALWGPSATIGSSFSGPVYFYYSSSMSFMYYHPALDNRKMIIQPVLSLMQPREKLQCGTVCGQVIWIV